MNKVDVLLGLQWGDEGKGKIVDILTPRYDIVARFQGGPNAGHTLEFDGNHVVLRSVPSGIFQCQGFNVIGNGVVLDPVLFKSEVIELTKYMSLDDLSKKIIISDSCHLISPLHKLQDKVDEALKGNAKVGTTGKGIGPAYATKSSRIGIRLGDVIDDPMKAQCSLSIMDKSLHAMIADIEGIEFDAEDMIKQIVEWMSAIKWIRESGFKVMNTIMMINESLKENKRVLAEGAQGTLLDIDFGTYPFVTSSNTSCGGVCTGLGIAPNKVGDVFGIFKAYCTRVGSGPFPTEDFTADGQKIREIGHEYGAVTGRERRCGWLDLDLLKYSCMLNGVTRLIMMKADVLSEFDTVKLLVNGEYKTFAGWKNQDLSSAKSYNELPETFRQYIEFIESETGILVYIISTSPDRNDAIIREDAIA